MKVNISNTRIASAVKIREVIRGNIEGHDLLNRNGIEEEKTISLFRVAPNTVRIEIPSEEDINVCFLPLYRGRENVPDLIIGGVLVGNSDRKGIYEDC